MVKRPCIYRVVPRTDGVIITLHVCTYGVPAIYSSIAGTFLQSYCMDLLLKEGLAGVDRLHATRRSMLKQPVVDPFDATVDKMRFSLITHNFRFVNSFI